jgi:pimeloyl-ACP methyl ester carboxylesterase
MSESIQRWRLRASNMRGVPAWRLLLVAACILATSSISARAACLPDADSGKIWLQGGSLCLAAAIAGTETAGPSPTLVVALHGDISAGGAADYMYSFIERMARPGIIAAAIIRPGYSDSAHRLSDGTNFDRRDSYTRDNISAIGAAIERLRTTHKASKVILVGHSGGAAIAAVIAAEQPTAINAAVLIACPCDIPKWRESRGRGPWPRSVSPHSVIARMPLTTRVIALTGQQDTNTTPDLAQDYIAALRDRGIAAEFRSTSGSHGFSDLAAATLRAIQNLVP